MKCKLLIVFSSISASLFPTSYTWQNVFTGGAWNNNTHWTPSGFPNAIGDIANFTNPPNPMIVTLGQPITIGQLIHTSPTTMLTIDATGQSLIFNNTPSAAVLTQTGTSSSLVINGPITLTSSVTISTLNGTLNGVISGPGGITATSTELSLTNVNTYGGSTVVNAGSFNYAADGCVPSTSAVTVGNGVDPATFNYETTISSGNAFAATINSSGEISPDTTSLAVDVYFQSLAGPGGIVEFPSTNNLFNIGGGSDTTFSGSLQGGQSQGASPNPDSGSRVVKTGTSNQTLAGLSSGLECPFFIANGIVTMQGDASLGNDRILVRATGSQGGLYFNQSVNPQNLIFLNGAGFNSLGALRVQSGTTDLSGNVTIGWAAGSETASDATINTDTGAILQIASLSGLKNLTYIGGGTRIYNLSTTNSFSGLTTINGGILQLDKTMSATAIEGNAVINSSGTLQCLVANQFSNSSIVTINNLGTFNLGGFAQTIGSLIFNKGGTFTQGAATLTLENNTSTALSLQDVSITGNLSFAAAAGGITYTHATMGTGATISGGILLASGTHVFDVAAASSVDLNISGVISGSSGAITKTSAGVLQFSGAGANTFTGLTTVSAGTLEFNKSSGTAAIGGDLTINGGTAQALSSNQFATTTTVTIGGGTFDITNQAQTIGSLIVNSGTYTSGSATLSLASSANTALTLEDVSLTGNLAFTTTGGITYTPSITPTGASISGNVSLASGTHVLNIASASTVDLTMSGAISGSGAAITKTTGGVLQFSGASANTFTGLTTVSAGTLEFNKSSGVAAIGGNLTINGGTAQALSSNQFATTTIVTIGGGTFDITNQAQTIGSLIVNSGTYTSGSATLSLASSANTALTLEDVNLTGNLGFTSTGGVTYTPSMTPTGASVSGNVSLASGTHVFNIASASTVDLGIIGAISGSGAAITKTGAGVLEFRGASPNTFDGLTTVSAGTLILGKSSGPGVGGDLTITSGTVHAIDPDQFSSTATVTIGGGTFNMQNQTQIIGRLVFTSGVFTSTGANLSLTNSSSTALSLQDVTIATGGLSFTTTGGVTYTPSMTPTGATISANVLLASGAHTFDITAASSVDLNVSGTITGSGGITKTNAGVLQIGGNTGNNTFTGLTTVSAGVLQFNKVSGLHAIDGNLTINGGTAKALVTQQFPTTTTVTIGGGTFDITNQNQTIGSLVFNSGSYTSGTALLSLASSLSTALSLQDVTVVGNLDFINAGGITYTSSAMTPTGAAIVDNIVLSANVHVFDIASETGSVDLNISGVISGTGAAITKTSAGVLQFSGSMPNTFTGLMTVSAGTFEMNNSSGVNAIGGNLTVNGGVARLLADNQIPDSSNVTIAGGTFDLNSHAETITSLTFNSGSYTSGSTTLDLLSAASTALTLQDVSMAGNLTFLSTGGVTYTPSTGSGATISGNLSVSSGTHVFDIASGSASVNLDVSGIISGMGAITKSASNGLLQFSGSSSNTYTGPTTVNAGTLRLNKSGGALAIVGDVVINGGTLSLNAAEQISDASLMTLSSGAFNMAGFSETLAILNFEGGTLTQGNAPLSLVSPIVALTMRNVAIPGPLVIGQGGDVVFDNTNGGSAQISGPVNLSGFITDFVIPKGSSSFDMTVSGAIVNGGLTKTGIGTLLLTGANTYSMGTLVSDGTLQGNTTSLQGNIVNNANLVFDQNFAGTYAGMISGTGTLIKQGSGKLTLTNDSSVGNALINAGSFDIEGTLSGPGTTVAASGTTVLGVGTIATTNFQLLGTLAPGHSIGTIHFIGASEYGAGSTLEIELNPSTSDLVDIVGALTIDPASKITILPDPGNYPAQFLYLIVQTTGGVTGTFSTVESSSVLFAGSVVYTPLDIFLEVTVKPFSQVTHLKNALAVANCLDSKAPSAGSDLEFLIQTLRFLPSMTEIEQALLQLQPSQYTSLAIAKEDDILYISNAVLNRLDTFSHSCDLENNHGIHAWAALLGGITNQDGLLSSSADEPGFTAQSPGISVGVDGTLCENFCLGANFSYLHSHMNWSQNRGKANIQGFFGSFYGKWFTRRGYLEGALLGGYDTYNTQRRIQFASIQRIARGKHHGYEGSAHLKGALTFDLNHTIVSPYSRLDYMYIHEKGFRESGAQSFDLSVRSKNSDLLSVEAGLDLSHCFYKDSKTFTPFVQGSIIWENRFLGSTEKALFENCLLTVTGLNPSRVLAGASAGVNLLVPHLKSTFSTFYRGKYGHGFQDNSLYLQYMREF